MLVFCISDEDDDESEDDEEIEEEDEDSYMAERTPTEEVCFILELLKLPYTFRYFTSNIL